MPIEIAPNQLPKTSEWLFPEYDFDRMNPEEYGGVVIERILERGTWGEVNWLFDYYREDKLAAWVREHGFRLLSSRSFALWRLVLNLKDFVAPEWAVKERSRPRRPAAATPRMKMYITLRRRGAGVGCPEPKDPPRRLTPSAPPERGFPGEELPMVT